MQKGALNLTQIQQQNGQGNHMLSRFFQLHCHQPHSTLPFSQTEFAFYLDPLALVPVILDLVPFLAFFGPSQSWPGKPDSPLFAVAEILPIPVYLQNSDFTTDYAGWTTWSENGAVFSAADSTLKADIYTTLPNTWSTQFYQNVDVYSSTTYRVSFRAKSSVSRPITIGVEGVNNAALFNSTFTATPEWQTYTYDFSPSVSCSGAKLLFFLGNVDGSQNVEHTVYFDDITLIPLPDDIVTNGNFANDLTSWSTWTENGSTYSVDAGEQCFVANIPTTLPNPWSAQLYQVIDVPTAGSYRVTFKAKASMNREIRLALEKDGQSPLMDETMSVSADWTNYSYDFTASSAASGVKLVFMLGNVGTTENMAHTISIDDISLYKVS